MSIEPNPPQRPRLWDAWSHSQLAVFGLLLFGAEMFWWMVVYRLLGEQRDGNFQHRIRAGGLGGLGRTAARLNDHAEDLAPLMFSATGSSPADIGRVVMLYYLSALLSPRR